VPRKPKTHSIRELAKLGRYDELRQSILAGERANLAAIFDRAVTDFRTVKRNPGHLQILKWCVDQGLDLEARGGWLNQPIYCLAAAAGNNEIVRYMLQKKPADNPFAWASLGELESLASYASEHDLSELQDENGFNLLFNCAQSGLGRRDEGTKRKLTEVCRLLVDRGVSPRHEVNFGLPISPAFLCAACGGNAEIMRLLLENGGLAAQRFHLVVEHSLEPHQRSGEPFYDVADRILQQGFDVNSLRPDSGRALLHASANRGTIKAVKWLLANGADPNRLDGCGRTPLHVCAQRNTSTAVAKLLIGAGSEPNALDSAGKTALDYARENNRAKIVEYLEWIGSR
jgi:ankyrin repeat protein